MKSEERPERVFAFIDSQNLNVGTQRSGWKMDWRKFRRFLTDKFGATRAYMFIGYVPEFEAMYEQLHEAGYAIVLKPTFDLTKPRPESLSEEGHQDSQRAHQEENEEKKPIKGNIDAELVLWAMKEMSNYDKAIIVSGDGDFYSLVEYLESKDRLLHILTPNAHYSSLYNRYESYVLRLDSFRKELAYKDHRKRRDSSN